MQNEYRGVKLIIQAGKKILLFLLGLVIVFLLVETVIHRMVRPSINSYGTFFGVELPPFNVFPSNFRVLTAAERTEKLNEWYEALIINDQKITKGDLWGVTRPDPTLGFVSLESAVSANGWWQSNSMGARSRSDTSETTQPGKTRVLFFGDSYTQGSRVPQEETFSAILDQIGTSIEPINFGVDGYSLGQAVLRFKTLADQLEFDHVMLSFSPWVDLWREVSVSRYIARNWGLYTILPRFVIENNELVLIKGPYQSLEEQISENRYTIQPKLRDHLKRYENHYFSFGFDSTPILDLSLMFKLYKKQRFEKEKKAYRVIVREPKSEATQIVKLLARITDQEVRRKGGRFTLLILPTLPSIRAYEQRPTFRQAWDAIIEEVCSSKIECLNLMPEFQSIGFQNLDTGYSGDHYGAITNGHTAKALAEFISRQTQIQKH